MCQAIIGRRDSNPTNLLLPSLSLFVRFPRPVVLMCIVVGIVVSCVLLLIVVSCVLLFSSCCVAAPALARTVNLIATS